MMMLTRKDAVATGLTGLAVFTYLATHEAWNVPLIGDSHRWAAAVILVLGIGACSVGARRVTSALFGVLGGVAFVLGVLALITGSSPCSRSWWPTWWSCGRSRQRVVRTALGGGRSPHE